MQTLTLTSFFPTKAEPSRGLFVLEQHLALKNLGVSSTIIKPQPWFPKALIPLIQQNPERWKLEGSSDYGLPVFMPRYPKAPGFRQIQATGLSLALRLAPFLVKHRDNIDIIHSHNILINGQAGAILSQIFNKPLVLTVHGENPALLDPKNTSLRHAARKVIAQVAHIMPVGTPLLPLLKELGADQRKITVVHNGFSTSKIARPRPRQKNWQDKFLILSASNLTKSKGVDDTLRAIRLLLDRGLTDIHFLIVGDGPYRTALEQLAVELDIQENVDFLGWKEHPEVMEYMSTCDLFCLPSWREAFGLVYLEAMAHGKPVIAVNDQGGADFVVNSQTGFLVPPKSPKAIADRIEILYKNRARAAEMGQRGKSLVVNEMTWQANAAKTKAIYEELLSDYKS